MPDGISLMSSIMSSKLPPLRNLPRWTRVGDLDRVRYPRVLCSDYTVRSPPVALRSPKAAAPGRTGLQDPRIASLEKDVLFLQQQHRDTLERLHAEMDALKRANKELQYQMVMEHEHSSKESIWSSGDSSKSCSAGSAEENPPCGLISSEEAGGAALTSLLPLRITCSPSQNPRTPTLKECELIIRQLHHANASQSQELLRIRTLLKDIASTSRSAEVSSLTRADTSRGGVFKLFPKLPLRPQPKKPLPRPAGGTVILPAIKRDSSVCERQRRAQDVHRTRLRRAND